MSVPTDPALETRSLLGLVDAVQSAPPHLLVIQGSSSSRFLLPTDGTVLVGRAPEVDLRIDSAAISRRHARFIVAHGHMNLRCFSPGLVDRVVMLRPLRHRRRKNLDILEPVWTPYPLGAREGRRGRP